MNTYTYPATITRVVDGDTVDASVDLGFRTFMNIRFRMEGYDAPETWRPKSEEERVLGQAATDYLKSLIDGKQLIVESNKFGKYRWLGTLYLIGDEESVNDKMIRAGHANIG